MMPPLMTVGIELRRLQHRRDQAGGGGLAVRAADRDRPFQPHQLGQHLGAAHHRDQPRARRRDLRVVALDRGGDDDDLRRAEIARRRGRWRPGCRPRAGGGHWRCRRCRCPAPNSRDCAAPRRCRTCRCRRCRRNGSCRWRAAAPSCARLLAHRVLRPDRRAARRRRAGLCARRFRGARTSVPGSASRAASRARKRRRVKLVSAASSRRRRHSRARGRWRSDGRRSRRAAAPGSRAGRRRASSATVEAPARAITRCAAASRSAMSGKKGASSAAMPMPA